MKKLLSLIAVLVLAVSLVGCKSYEYDPIWENASLREALTKSIDREAIVEALGAGEIPATGMVPPGFLDNNDNDFKVISGDYGIATDDSQYAEAKKLFAQAATELGLTEKQLIKKLNKKTYLFNNTDTHKTVAELIQNMWQQNLGFTIKTEYSEWATFQDVRTSGQFDLARGGWITDFMDPSGLLGIFVPNNSYNDSGYDNPAYTAAIEEAGSATDPEVHFAKLYEAHAILMADEPIIPLFHYTSQVLIKEKVKDWSRSVLGAIDFSTAGIEESSGETSKVINFNIGADPKTLDPGLNGASDGGHVINNTFEGLVREKEGVISPGMAESWDVSEDGLTVTFNIRDDAKWSDGTALTADDFVYSWLRAMDPRTASEYSWIWEYTYIEGANEFFKYGQEEDENFDIFDVANLETLETLKAAVGIASKEDGKILEINLTQPNNWLISLLSFYHFMPVPESIVSDTDKVGEEGFWAKNAADGYAISNGPYKLTEYTVGGGLKLEKNEHYWNAENVGIDVINGSFTDETSTAYSQYKADGLDVMVTIPPTEIPNLIATSEEIHIFPLLGTYYINFGLNNPDRSVVYTGGASTDEESTDDESTDDESTDDESTDDESTDE